MRGWAMACLPTLLVATPVLAEAPWPSGTYGNVRTHGKTGDMLGMEARFFEQGGRPMVEFVWCYGWCNDVYVVPLERTAAGFAFHYDEPNDQGPIRFDMAVTPIGRTIRVVPRQNGQCFDECRPEALKAMKRPFAIPFAKANGAR